MSRVNLYFVLLPLALVAGCAGHRDNLAGTAPAAPEPVTIAAVAPIGQPTTVDGNALAQRSPIICREMLKPNSNVHTNQCMTATDWERWERLEAKRAAELVRMMQGGRYR
jgi:hypothetical protein